MAKLRGVGLNAAAWGLACSQACAPSQGFRPAGVLDAGYTQELGLGFSSVEARPYVDESPQYLGQVWWTATIEERWSLTALAAFDSSAALAGAALRFDVASGRRAAFALELEGGLFWVAGALPATLRLWKGVALYTAPRLGTWGAQLTPFVPLGLSVRVADALVIRAEGELSWADFQYYNRRLHWGLAIAHQW